MTEEELFFNSIGEEIENSIKSQMFGKPCFKIEKKAFVCFFQNEMVFKLRNEEHKEALNLEGSKLFDPSGKDRAMKEWVQVSFVYKNQWEYFAKASAEYVANK